MKINKKRKRNTSLIFNNQHNPYHHKECTQNCNYHIITVNKNSLRKEKNAWENQQINATNDITIAFLRLVEALSETYTPTWFISDPIFCKWRSVYLRYQRYVYSKMIKKSTVKNWLKEKLGQEIELFN